MKDYVKKLSEAEEMSITENILNGTINRVPIQIVDTFTDGTNFYFMLDNGSLAKIMPNQ
jgi:hypothetical protein